MLTERGELRFIRCFLTVIGNDSGCASGMGAKGTDRIEKVIGYVDKLLELL